MMKLLKYFFFSCFTFLNIRKPFCNLYHGIIRNKVVIFVWLLFETCLIVMLSVSANATKSVAWQEMHALPINNKNILSSACYWQNDDDDDAGDDSEMSNWLSSLWLNNIFSICISVFFFVFIFIFLCFACFKAYSLYLYSMEKCLYVWTADGWPIPIIFHPICIFE